MEDADAIGALHRRFHCANALLIMTISALRRVVGDVNGGVIGEPDHEVIVEPQQEPVPKTVPAPTTEPVREPEPLIPA
jgi:hypothetical protein